MTERIRCENRDMWLERRRMQGIGASEAAAAVGLSKWQTPAELWREKVGLKAPDDLSGNEAVQRGVRMEPAIRAMFAATHPELTVEHHPFDMLYQTERPWLFATLDGELTGPVYPKGGSLEIKSVEIRSKAGWDEWDGKVPQHYYCQVLHQFAATGFEIIWLYPALITQSGITLREYVFYREECLGDIDWLIAQEEKFMRCVENGIMPSVPITF